MKIIVEDYVSLNLEYKQFKLIYFNMFFNDISSSILPALIALSQRVPAPCLRLPLPRLPLFSPRLGQRSQRQREHCWEQPHRSPASATLHSPPRSTAQYP
mmetsp:Transcript_27566/g.38343  ORF Transcript_27566/g.38343 Transcript_27566/m.38343 type:complete len:100 (-) Transcript_27566:216-515(-)